MTRLAWRLLYLELPIERAFALLLSVTVPLLTEFITVLIPIVMNFKVKKQDMPVNGVESEVQLGCNDLLVVLDVFLS